MIAGFVTGLVFGIDDGASFFFLIFGASLIVAYLTSLFLYGFGELIESSQDTSIATRMILDRLDHKEKEAFVSAVPGPATPATQRAASPAVPAARPASAARLQDGKWKCLCGRINEKYLSSCACGRNKREVLYAESAGEN